MFYKVTRLRCRVRFFVFLVVLCQTKTSIATLVEIEDSLLKVDNAVGMGPIYILYYI